MDHTLWGLLMRNKIQAPADLSIHVPSLKWSEARIIMHWPMESSPGTSAITDLRSAVLGNCRSTILKEVL